MKFLIMTTGDARAEGFPVAAVEYRDAGFHVGLAL